MKYVVRYLGSDSRVHHMEADAHLGESLMAVGVELDDGQCVLMQIENDGRLSIYAPDSKLRVEPNASNMFYILPVSHLEQLDETRAKRKDRQRDISIIAPR